MEFIPVVSEFIVKEFKEIDSGFSLEEISVGTLGELNHRKDGYTLYIILENKDQKMKLGLLHQGAPFEESPTSFSAGDYPVIEQTYEEFRRPRNYLYLIQSDNKN